MLMTIRVPDNVIGLKYTKLDADGYPVDESMELTQIVRVEREPEEKGEEEQADEDQ